MGVTATTRLPAGWYPDPEGGNRRRWWDGREWTQYTAEFQKPTTVDESEDVTPAAKATKTTASKAKGAKAAKPAKAPVPKAAKPARTAKTTKPAASAEEAIVTDAHPPLVHRSAQRLGWWLAGATHKLGNSGKRHGRRARRRNG